MASGYESEELFGNGYPGKISDTEQSDISGSETGGLNTFPFKSKPSKSHDRSKRRKVFKSSDGSETESSEIVAPILQRTPTGRPKQKEQARCLNYPPKSSSSDGSYGTMVSALGELTNTLNKVVKRLEKTESRIMSMEEKILSTTPSSSGSEHHFKSRKVPVFVRSETRKMYQTLLEDADSFVGFSIGQNITFKDPTNQAISGRLVKEVQAINSTFIAADIRSAAYTYYKTLCQEESLRRRGVSDQRKKQRRRRERTARKLQERQAVFKKLSYAEKDKEKWQKVFNVNFMSSEESDVDGDDAIQIRPLPWRAERVTSFLHSLDRKSNDEKSPQAKRQMKMRQMGNSSKRLRPTHDSNGQTLPSWLFAICNN